MSSLSARPTRLLICRSPTVFMSLSLLTLTFTHSIILSVYIHILTHIELVFFFQAGQTFVCDYVREDEYSSNLLTARTLLGEIPICYKIFTEFTAICVIDLAKLNPLFAAKGVP